MRAIGFALQPLPAEAEVGRLRAALVREVPGAFAGPGLNEREWIASTRAALDSGSHLLSEAQVIVVVDRNPAVHELGILLAGQGWPWSVIGRGEVSTGQAGRRGYYLTPTGVFPHAVAILDYRAEGTFNQNHIRGLGVRGMRIWDVGWQQAGPCCTDLPSGVRNRLGVGGCALT